MHRFARGMVAVLTLMCACRARPEPDAPHQLTQGVKNAAYVEQPTLDTLFDYGKVVRPRPIDPPPPPPPPPPPAEPGPVIDVLVRDETAFVLREVSLTSAPLLETYDVAGAAPLRLGTLPLTGAPSALALHGDLLLVAAGHVGVSVVDVLDPSTPTLVRDVDTPGAANDVSLAGDFAVVADGPTGLAILDVHSAKTLALISTLATGFDTTRIVADGSRVHLAGGTQLAIVEASQPTAPSVTSMLALPGYVTDLALRGHTLLAASFAPALMVIDVTVPSSPVVKAELPLSGEVPRVLSDGTLTLVAGQRGVIQHVALPALTYPHVTTTQAVPTDVRALALVGEDRIAVGSSNGLALVDVAARACATDVPLHITFDGTPVTWADFVPWQPDERAYLESLLGVRDEGGVQRCVGFGLIDRITRLVGAPDVIVEADGVARFPVNIAKLPGATGGWYDGTNIAVSVLAGNSLGAGHAQILAHELSHAFMQNSLPGTSQLIDEGMAVAVDTLIAPDIGHEPYFGAWLDACAENDGPGLGMVDGATYNHHLHELRYVVPGCFFARLEHAQAGTLAHFRALASQVVPDDPVGAHPLLGALEASLPPCIEDQDAATWLAAQPIYEMDQEVPSLDVHLTFGAALGTSQVILYQRTSGGDGYVNETLPRFSTPLALEHPADFFGAMLSGGYSVRNSYGQLVGPAQRAFTLQTVGLDLFGPLAPSVPLIDFNTELGPCPSDTNGDGVRNCRAEVRVGFRADYVDPTTGEPRVVERTRSNWVFRGGSARPVFGVTRAFTDGRVRITLPSAGLVFEARVEHGTFRLPTRGYRTRDPLAACSLDTDSHNACPLTGPAPAGCPTLTETWVPDDELATYRGPVRVERVIVGYAGDVVVDPRVRTKLSDRLWFVY